MVFGEGVTLYEVKNEGYPDPSNERASIWKNLDKRGDNHGQMLSLTVTKIMAVSAFYYYGMKQKWKHQKIADVPRDESFKYKSVNYAHLTVISEIIIR